MKKYTILFMILFCFMLFNVNVSAEDIVEEIPAEVLDKAEKSVDIIKNHCLGNPEQWGFANESEIKSLEFGQGYIVKCVDKDEIQKATGKSVDEIVDENIYDSWLFTLDLNGVPRFFFTVGYEDEQCRLVGFGGNATRFGKTRLLLESQVQDNSISVSNKIIKIGVDYYFVVNKEQEEYIVPVIEEYSDSDVRMMSENDISIIETPEFVEMLRKDIDTTSEGERAGSPINGLSTKKSTKASLIKKITVITISVLFMIVMYDCISLFKIKNIR